MNLLRPLSPLARTSASSLVLALAGLLSHGAASAQNGQIPAALIGDWKATWRTDLQTYETEVVISESKSTWKTSAGRNIKDPCWTKLAPMKLDSVEGDRVRFTVQFSEALRGCRDIRLTLKTGNTNPLTGTYDGRAIELLAAKN